MQKNEPELSSVVIAQTPEFGPGQPPVRRGSIPSIPRRVSLPQRDYSPPQHSIDGSPVSPGMTQKVFWGPADDHPDLHRLPPIETREPFKGTPTIKARSVDAVLSNRMRMEDSDDEYE